MLFLVFRLGADRYALGTDRVVEVLPLVEVKALPKAPPGVVGLFAYRGKAIPLLDLTELALGRASQHRTSTRIVVVQVGAEAGQAELLGLCAERATETMRRAESDFVESPVSVRDAPYLGPISRDERGIIQRVILERLLPPAVLQSLLRGVSGEAAC